MSNREDMVDVALKCFQAYVDDDRATLETLIADDFRFTSPLDNRIDRARYFQRCWPNHQTITAFEFRGVVASGDRVFVSYEGTSTSGRRFRNTEIMTIRGGQVREVEVYFGWDVPHQAPEGESLPPASGS